MERKKEQFATKRGALGRRMYGFRCYVCGAPRLSKHDRPEWLDEDECCERCEAGGFERMTDMQTQITMLRQR